MKDYEQLTFRDDFFFCKILQENPALCKELTETIVERKIGEIVTISRQLPIEITADGKGVRFDVFFEDDTSAVYDIEMQIVPKKDLPMRARYYQGMIDLEQLNRGDKYADLSHCTVIFICAEDIFGLNQFKYTYRYTCKELPELLLDDGTEKIFLNASGTTGNVSDDLRAFLQYIAGKVTDNQLVTKLEAEVTDARLHKKWRAEYMTLLEKYEEQQEIGSDEVSAMYSWLQLNGRADEMQRALTDKELRKALLCEFRKANSSAS